MFILRTQFYMAFYAAALAISVTVLLSTLIQKRTERPQNKWFLLLIFIIISNSISEIGTALAEPYALETGNYFYISIFQNTYFLLHTALCPMLSNYVASVTGKNRQRSHLKQFFIHLPFFITEIFVIINPFTHIVFMYDEHAQLVRNWAEYCIYVAALFYFALSVFELLFSWHAITRRRSFALSYFFILTFVGVLIQLLNIDIKAELFAESIALIGAMLAVEMEDDRIDADNGIYNRRALQMDVKNCIVLNENTHLLLIKIINGGNIEKLAGTSNTDIITAAVSEFLKTVVAKYKIYHPNRNTFAILCSSMKEEQIKKLKSELELRFQRTWPIYGFDVNLNAVIIDIVLPKDINNYDDVAYLADTAIPLRVGNNQASIDWLLRRLDVERAIRRGLFYESFEVYYQPTVNLSDFSIHGAEALIRLNDPTLGYISPEEFIPIAENLGLVEAIDDFVLNKVCAFIKSKDFSDKLDCININLSVVQCLKPGFYDHLIKIVDSYGVDHSLINFEITETFEADDYETLANVVYKLKNAGFTISMDDYGTGYSNIEGIFSLNFDVVKIDKSILWNATNDSKGRIILQNCIRMIHELNCKVLIEGVENEKHIQLLKTMNVDYLQGYYFSKPLTQSKFIEYMAI